MDILLDYRASFFSRNSLGVSVRNLTAMVRNFSDIYFLLLKLKGIACMLFDLKLTCANFEGLNAQLKTTSLSLIPVQRGKMLEGIWASKKLPVL